ncbi:MAG: pyridoxamine 5'-phosphate oxidase family protein [Lactobacillus rogosae]|nr:pyridoxamine 5'-phosphate oxidase family protein [Lactobacillus rogosae]
MERVLKFLKEVETYYLATVEGDQPRVRPFGTAHIFEGKLYIQTGKIKDVSKQIHANPKVEICAFKDGEWLRVAGELVEDDRKEARQSMLDAYPSLQKCIPQMMATLKCSILRMQLRHFHLLHTSQK